MWGRAIIDKISGIVAYFRGEDPDVRLKRTYEEARFAYSERMWRLPEERDAVGLRERWEQSLAALKEAAADLPYMDRFTMLQMVKMPPDYLELMIYFNGCHCPVLMKKLELRRNPCAPPYSADEFTDCIWVNTKGG
jgi:hypothetical protein